MVSGMFLDSIEVGHLCLIGIRSGSFATAMSLSTAYISDCNAEEKRNVHIGKLVDP
jgi:hypothetical protein